MHWEIANATIITPTDTIRQGLLSIEGNRITGASDSSRKQNAQSLRMDVSGLIASPGIIDGHDHLLGSYRPRVGDRRPYLNWLAWDNDLKASPIYKERQQIESSYLYKLGAYRHLITGVTSVQDHIPHFVRELFASDLPIRLLKDYAVAHSITSFALKWGDSIEKEHQKAVDNNLPFITHGSEGFDQETIDTVKTLAEKNALSPQTVIIHGIALSDSDIDLLARNKCSVVWCPVSNLYMFEKTAPVKKLLEKGVNVVLGTDSPMSGSINIFEEIEVAQKYYRKTYGETLDEKILFAMMTTNAARAFKQPDLGSLREGALADFILVDGDAGRPIQSVLDINYEKLMLSVIDGKPVYGDPAFVSFFEELDAGYQKVMVAGTKKIVSGDLLGLLENVRKAVRYEKQIEFLPVEPW